jgi:hypothetical protein
MSLSLAGVTILSLLGFRMSALLSRSSSCRGEANRERLDSARDIDLDRVFRGSKGLSYRLGREDFILASEKLIREPIRSSSSVERG